MKLNLEGKTLLAILNFWTESVTNFEVKMQMAKGYEKWKKKSRNSWQMEILLGIGIARKTVDYDFIHTHCLSLSVWQNKKNE